MKRIGVMKIRGSVYLLRRMSMPQYMMKSISCVWAEILKEVEAEVKL